MRQLFARAAEPSALHLANTDLQIISSLCEHSSYNSSFPLILVPFLTCFRPWDGLVESLVVWILTDNTNQGPETISLPLEGLISSMREEDQKLLFGPVQYLPQRK
jgi:hypothetical protein